MLTRLPPSKCLADAYKVLGGFNPRHRVKVMSKIDSYRADRRRIAQAQPYIVGIERRKVMEADRGKDVSSVVEDGQPQTILNIGSGMRASELRINCSFPPLGTWI